MDCPTIRRQIETFQHRLDSEQPPEPMNGVNPTDSMNGTKTTKSTESANSTLDIKSILEENLGLICQLAHDRTEGLTDLAVHIRNVLLGDGASERMKLWGSTVSTFAVREFILKAAQRKLYGIKPGPKMNKNEETNPVLTAGANQWKECRLFVWECFDNAAIDSAFDVDAARKEMKIQSAAITKYAAFCKKFEVISTKQSVSDSEREEQLQKIEDGIVSWKSKQEAAERVRLQREEEQKKKKFSFPSFQGETCHVT